MNKVLIGGAVGATGSTAGSSSWTNLTGTTGTFTMPGLNLERQEMEMTPYITINLVKANGCTIVVCRKDNTSTGSRPEYFIIPESSRNFDKELGKIISLYMLKT